MNKYLKQLYNTISRSISIFDIKTNGEYKVLKGTIKTATNKAILFDIGGNKGDYTELALKIAKQYNKSIEVHVFEPQILNYNLLKTKFSKYPFVILNNCALSNETGTMPIYTESPGSPLGSLYKRKFFNEQGYVITEEIIKVTTLELYINSKNIDNIDLIKIDVEGNELKVIQGLGDLLNSHMLKILKIQFEYGGTFLDSNSKLKDIFSLLSPFYKLGKISNRKIKFVDYSANLEDYKYSNYISILKN